MATSSEQHVAEAALRLSILRPRELEVLVAYSLGLTTHEVASLFYLSPLTVRTHVKNAMRRLGVVRRDDAVALVVSAADARIVTLAAHRISEPVRQWLATGDSRDDLEALVRDAREGRR